MGRRGGRVGEAKPGGGGIVENRMFPERCFGFFGFLGRLENFFEPEMLP